MAISSLRPVLLLVVIAFSACVMDPAGDAAHLRQRSQIWNEGIVLVSDACIYRQSPPLEPNYYLIPESVRAAAAVEVGITGQLVSSGYRVARSETPFVCGSLYIDPPRGVNVAEGLGRKPYKAAIFPIAVAAFLKADPPLQQAYQQLMKVAAEMIGAGSTAGRRHEHLSPEQSALLRKHFGTPNLLISLGRGASISTGMKAFDAVAGLLLAGQIGGGGCSLSEKDCGLADTGHDGFRLNAVLIDLEDPELSWLGVATDIAGHQGLLENSDPLDPGIYTDPSWAPKLLKSFPDRFHRL